MIWRPSLSMNVPKIQVPGLGTVLGFLPFQCEFEESFAHQQAGSTGLEVDRTALEVFLPNNSRWHSFEMWYHKERLGRGLG